MIAADYGRGLVQMMRGNLDEARKRSRSGVLAFARERSPAVPAPRDVRARKSLFAAGPRRAGARHPASGQGRGRSSSAMQPAWLRCRLISARPTVSSAMSSTDWLSCAPARPAPSRRATEASRRLAVLAEANILASQGASAAAEAIGCMNRTIEIASRLEARPLLGAARGLLARAPGRFRQDGRGAGRTRPGDHAF